METKTLGEYLHGYNIDDNTKATLASYILYGDSRGLTKNDWRGDYKNRKIPKEYHMPKDVVDLMAKVNSMVKDRNCPNNLRNRFYGKKLRVIEELMREGRITEIYEEGYCYSVCVDGKYYFHQLKDDHPKWEKEFGIKGKREYVRGQATEFNKGTYAQFMIAATLYVGLKKKELADMLSPKSKGRK